MTPQDRGIRDVIDDILVHMDMLEAEIASISRNEEYKGRIVRIQREIESIHDLLVELRRRTRESCGRGY